MLTDVHVHLGSWPFTLHREFTAATLRTHLRAHGIGRALVSHLGAVLAPDPGPSNRALFAAVRKTPGLIPLPTLNPALANWREELDDCSAAAALRAVRIIPNYHNYRLNSGRWGEFMALLARRRLRLVIQVRLEDERHRYFALQIKGVSVSHLAGFLQRFPRQHSLLLGCYLPEVRELAAKVPNFSTDTAFTEWEDTMVSLGKALPSSRIMFGSHSPLHTTAAQVAKLRGARITAAARGAIGRGTATHFLDP